MELHSRWGGGKEAEERLYLCTKPRSGARYLARVCPEMPSRWHNTLRSLIVLEITCSPAVLEGDATWKGQLTVAGDDCGRVQAWSGIPAQIFSANVVRVSTFVEWNLKKTWHTWYKNLPRITNIDHPRYRFKPAPNFLERHFRSPGTVLWCGRLDLGKFYMNVYIGFWIIDEYQQSFWIQLNSTNYILYNKIKMVPKTYCNLFSVFESQRAVPQMKANLLR